MLKSVVSNIYYNCDIGLGMKIKEALVMAELEARNHIELTELYADLRGRPYRVERKYIGKRSEAETVINLVRAHS